MSERERTAEGRSRAKARGKSLGRKHKLTTSQQAEAREQIIKALGTMRDLRVIVRRLRLTRADFRDMANRALAESYEREITDAR